MLLDCTTSTPDKIKVVRKQAEETEASVVEDTAPSKNRKKGAKRQSQVQAPNSESDYTVLTVDEERRVAGFYLSLRDETGSVCDKESGRPIEIRLARWSQKNGIEELEMDDSASFSSQLPSDTAEEQVEKQEDEDEDGTKGSTDPVTNLVESSKIKDGVAYISHLRLTELTPQGMYALTLKASPELFPGIFPADSIESATVLVHVADVK